ncbi:MAG: NCS2 family permease, partial [Spirochaetota bacterium]|nr:NCS2 family permease [Spirochaetota bacterium]
GIQDIMPYLGIAIPMGIMSFFGTLQNLESASAAGDNYPAIPSLGMNGIGTMVGSIFGSPFPTTVYIGHPGWKGLGARSGYSIINGAVISIICLTGMMSIISCSIPIEAGYPILLWIGLVITAQAFQTTPKEHAPAVAIGLLPAISAWGLSLLKQYINHEGKYSTNDINSLISSILPHLKGIIIFSEGPLLSAMFITAVTVYLIEKEFLKSVYWTIPLVICSYFGFIHSTEIGMGMAGQIPLGYTLFALIIFLVYLYNRFTK